MFVSCLDVVLLAAACPLTVHSAVRGPCQQENGVTQRGLGGQSCHAAFVSLWQALHTALTVHLPLCPVETL